VELLRGAGEVAMARDRLDVSQLAKLDAAINRKSRLVS
jgi:hypothetical protein